MHPTKFDHGALLRVTEFEIPNYDICTTSELLDFIKPKAAELLITGLRNLDFVPPLKPIWQPWLPLPGAQLFEDVGEYMYIRHANKVGPEDKKITRFSTSGHLFRRHRALGRLWCNIFLDNEKKRVIFEDLTPCIIIRDVPDPSILAETPVHTETPLKVEGSPTSQKSQNEELTVPTSEKGQQAANTEYEDAPSVISKVVSGKQVAHETLPVPGVIENTVPIETNPNSSANGPMPSHETKQEPAVSGENPLIAVRKGEQSQIVETLKYYREPFRISEGSKKSYFVYEQGLISVEPTLQWYYEDGDSIVIPGGRRFGLHPFSETFNALRVRFITVEGQGKKPASKAMQQFKTRKNCL